MAVHVDMDTGPDALARGLLYALNPEDSDDETTRTARRIAAVLIVERLALAGTPPEALDEIRAQCRDIHPGIFPQAVSEMAPGDTTVGSTPG